MYVPPYLPVDSPLFGSRDRLKKHNALLREAQPQSHLLDVNGVIPSVLLLIYHGIVFPVDSHTSA